MKMARSTRKLNPMWVVNVCFLLLFLMCEVRGQTQNKKKSYGDWNGGSWEVVVENAGVSAMHMALLYNNKVIMFDHKDFGPSNISLPVGKCGINPQGTSLQPDCWAHSIEYDIATNKIRPLMLQTNPWCSSGAYAPDGRLIQTGGFNDGERVVRAFLSCEDDDDECEWEESLADGTLALAVRRWYATDQILPDGRIIVIGGRRQFNYEFVPKMVQVQQRRMMRQNDSEPKQNVNVNDRMLFDFSFLWETRDSAEIENNLYPFVHLTPDGNLFIFANKRSVLLDYSRNRIVREYPEIPGGEARNYPSSGGSVLLPLDARNGFQHAEVLICGGAHPTSFLEAKRGNFLPASNTCGRLKITDPDPQWEMETMPRPRVMGDMLLLPTADVLIINGAERGTAGWGAARNPALHPFLYSPHMERLNRFSTLNPSTIPRVYHSTSHLLPDGRVLVGGSNTNVHYNFTGAPFPTELRLEAFSPPYLNPSNRPYRPTIKRLDNHVIGYGSMFRLRFSVAPYVRTGNVFVSLVSPYFTTHGYSQNQRMLRLNITQISLFSLSVTAPPSKNLAPPGYYLLFLVHRGIPSFGVWVQLR